MESDSETKHVHVIVEGKVQAVGFRYFTWQTARELKITGWVRNRDDGSVEIEAEGKTDAVNTFVNQIKKGSPFSKVRHVDVQVYKHSGNFSTFEIRDMY
ncbi:acylphosphatase [Sporolactobacillus sp. Y61]|uniref:acylphosphatase n=1 Tax=Sporolactobacillus sp. Y61 TaxID=3160863 RepID=A0AAU8IF09_9BACL